MDIRNPNERGLMKRSLEVGCSREQRDKVIRLEVYDANAGGQNADGAWPTKMICVSESWLNEYARQETRYQSAEDLLANYTFDEVAGIEEWAQKVGIERNLLFEGEKT